MKITKWPRGEAAGLAEAAATALVQIDEDVPSWDEVAGGLDAVPAGAIRFEDPAFELAELFAVRL
jgi:hypothetical protein